MKAKHQHAARFRSRKIAALLATADQGRVLREGVRVVIRSNECGKSSLLNRLLGTIE
jgi:tRNA U34 5-carboxymethylaminomethyl modifying GTPase MnmE/TrmE